MTDDKRPPRPPRFNRDDADSRGDSRGESRIERPGRAPRDGERPVFRGPARESQSNRDTSGRDERGFDAPRSPRREGEFDSRPPRREGFDSRPPRRESGFDSRPPRREGGFDSRPPRREGGFDSPRPPRREGEFDARPTRRDRPDRAAELTPRPMRDDGDRTRRSRDDTSDAPRREREQVWHHQDSGKSKPMFGPARAPRANASERAPVRERDAHEPARAPREGFRDRAPAREGFRDRPPARENFRDRGPPREGFRGSRDTERGADRGFERAPRQRDAEAPPHGSMDADGNFIPRYRDHEIRLYGVNACRAVFAKRPQDIRKVFIDRAQLQAWTDVLTFCAEQRVGYTLVERDELPQITKSDHHEGVCFAVKHLTPSNFDHFAAGLESDAKSDAVLVWIEGVGNPHNLGAILRAAAHFGALAVLHEQNDAIALSPSAVRIAEGAAEFVPLIAVPNRAEAMTRLHQAGFKTVASVVREAKPLFRTPLPARSILILGAEGEGLSDESIEDADLAVLIPGSGWVESLNVAHAASVLLGEWWRQHRIK